MSRPVIGVAWPQADYVAALEQAGAQVRELTPATDPMPGALSACDGLLLTGGPDVDPATYGETERHPTVEVDPARDAYELELARHALAGRLPLFGICRGAQVLNVAAGGTLFQDLSSQHPEPLLHTLAASKTAMAHDIAVSPTSCLAVLMHAELDSQGRIAVNSRHHQSVKDLAPGFLASATGPDGVIEAIENPAAPFCVGVQWHPENFWRTGKFSALFAGLIEAARKYGEQRARTGSEVASRQATSDPA
jgi:putative glutamine amidotransferase